MLARVEYIWLDGAKPTRKLRSKTKVIDLGANPELADFSEWSYDGSSTVMASSPEIVPPLFWA